MTDETTGRTGRMTKGDLIAEMQRRHMASVSIGTLTADYVDAAVAAMFEVTAEYLTMATDKHDKGETP